MRRLIQHLGIALITFILGLFALDLWTVWTPRSTACHPKHKVIIEKQDKHYGYDKRRPLVFLD